MRLNSLQKIACPAVVEEENPLAQTPQGRGAEFIGTGSALHNIIRQPASHVVNQQIRKQVGLYTAQGCG